MSINILIKFAVPLLLLTIVSCGGSSKSNISPKANAGNDMTVNEQTEASLTGSGVDSDGSITSYSWIQQSGPSVTISTQGAATATFTTPNISSDQTLTFQLTVTDNQGATSTDNIDVIVVAVVTVMSMEPNDNSSNVDRGTDITLIFDEPMDIDTLANNITLSDSNGDVVNIESLNVIDNTVVISPKLKLFAETTYTLSVSDQIKSLAGANLPVNYTATFTTESATWSTPVAFKYNGGNSTTAINDKGDIITASWGYNYATGIYEITIFERTDNKWSEGKVVSSAPNVYHPKISMDNNGNAIIIWANWSVDGIMVMEFRGGKWGTPWVISPAGRHYSIAMSDNGYAVISSINNGNILLNEYIDDAWNETILINQTNPNQPFIALNNNGGGLLTWSHNNRYGQTDTIFGSIRKDNVWSEPQKISNTGKINDYFGYAVDNKGDSIIVWESRSDNHINSTTYKNEYRNSEWKGIEILDSTVDKSFSPRVSMSNNNTATITWEQGTLGLTNNIVYKVFKNGSWGGINLLGEGNRPSIVTSADGNGVIAWEYRSENHRELRLSQSNAGVWSTPIIFSTSDNYLNGMGYVLKINYSGDVSMVWHQSDNSNWYLYRSILE